MVPQDILGISTLRGLRGSTSTTRSSGSSGLPGWPLWSSSRQVQCLSFCSHSQVATYYMFFALNVGCQTFWTNFPGLEQCRDLASIQRYITEYYRHIFHMEDTEIKLITGCPAPCHFTEFRVGKLREFHLF